MSYSPTLGRWMQTDPIGYADGLNLQEFVRSNPPNLLDPNGTASVAVTPDTGSVNEDEPWIGAAWASYISVPNDGDNNPGYVRFGLVKVDCTCTEDCDGSFEVQCTVTFKLQIHLRNVEDKQVIERIDGERVLTDEGRLVYGHEQLHVKDYITGARELAEGIVQNVVDGANAEDCRQAAADAKRELQRALNEFRDARQPGKDPDVTHGGPGQPLPREDVEPEGEPGPFVES